MKKILLLLTVLSLCFVSCSKEKNETEVKDMENETSAVSEDAVKGEPMFVTVAVLNVRSEPTLKGEKVGSVVLGEEVSVIAKTEEKITVNGITESWFQIESEKVQGWVFGGFLSEKKVRSTEVLVKELSGHYFRGRDQRIVIKGTKYRAHIFIEDGSVETLEGTVTYQANNIVLTPYSSSYVMNELTEYGYSYENVPSDKKKKLSAKEIKRFKQKMYFQLCGQYNMLYEKPINKCKQDDQNFYYMYKK